MGFMFCDLHVSLNPSSGDINSSNLSCYLLIFHDFSENSPTK